MVIMVWCPRCRVEKALDQFGRNRAQRTGRQVYCFACCRAIARDRREWLGEDVRPRTKNNAQGRARQAVARALKSGRLERPPVCPVCQVGDRKVEAHHWLGYAKRHWLRVRWMCRSCHQSLHHNDR